MEALPTPPATATEKVSAQLAAFFQKEFAEKEITTKAESPAAAAAATAANLQAEEIADLKAENAELKTKFQVMHTELRRLKEKVKDLPEGGASREITVKLPDKEIKLQNEILHEEFDFLLMLAANKQNVYLYGPAGSGKSHTVKQIAKALDKEFYYTGAISQDFQLKGFIDAGGKYHETEFYRAFKNGGIFFIDELDSSLPDVLTSINTALANGYFEFPEGKINAHKDFVCFAAGNTCGGGATAEYTGRYVIDISSLNRFVKVHFDYSKKLDAFNAGGNTELVDFCHTWRNITKQKHITRALFTYRDLAQIALIEKIACTEKALRSSIAASIAPDTLRQISNGISDIIPGNEYAKTLSYIAAC